MIALDEQALKAIGNARALLDAMLTSAWETAYIAGPEGEYFFAREAGAIDPLRAPPIAAEAAPSLPMAEPMLLPAITAPHVGTIVSLAPVGTAIMSGQVIAVLSVLDEMVDVLATQDGVVARLMSTMGDLAEYGTVLLELRGM